MRRETSDPASAELAKMMLLVIDKLQAKLPDYRFTVVCRHKDENSPYLSENRNVVASTEVHRLIELEKVATLVVEFGRRAEVERMHSAHAQFVIDTLDEMQQKRERKLLKRGSA